MKRGAGFKWTPRPQKKLPSKIPVLLGLSSELFSQKDLSLMFDRFKNTFLISP